MAKRGWAENIVSRRNERGGGGDGGGGGRGNEAKEYRIFPYGSVPPPLLKHFGATDIARTGKR